MSRSPGPPALAAAVLLAAAAAAQAPPRASSSLEFAGGDSIRIGYNQLDLAKGRTLERLLRKDERGATLRGLFNRGMFRSRVGGRVHLGADAEVGGARLARGSYILSFEIDEQLRWSMVLLDGDEEKAATIPLDVARAGESISRRLVIEVVAAQGDAPEGHLRLRFGGLSAKVPFRLGAARRKGGETDREPAKEKAGKKPGKGRRRGGEPPAARRAPLVVPPRRC